MKRDGREGMVLMLVLVAIVLLASVGLVSYTITMSDMRVLQNQVRSTQALYHADAGIKLTKRTVESRLEQGESLEDILGQLYIAPPEGFTFDPIDDFETMLEGQAFRFVVAGRDHDTIARVQVSLRRLSLLELGIFGDVLVSLYPGMGVYSYDSRVQGRPTPADSTGKAPVGSNRQINLQSGAFVDGHFVLGASAEGIQGVCGNCYPDYNVILRDYIEPDPFGVINGIMAQDLAAAAISNDNDRVSEIHGINLRIRPNETLTLSSGVYYLHDLDLGPGSEMVIDASDGPVRIYITGQFKALPTNILNLSGDPFDLQVICNSDEKISIQPMGNFQGIIYAPNAEVLAMPGGEYRGLVWGREAHVKPGSGFYVDLALLDRMFSNLLVVNHWKELRY